MPGERKEEKKEKKEDKHHHFNRAAASSKTERGTRMQPRGAVGSDWGSPGKATSYIRWSFRGG
jgi:hypothetical protein